jgi:hypothetical protein
MRARIIAMSVLAALIMAALALPAGAHNTNDAVGSQTKHRPSMGPGGKLTSALLKKGESQSLAEVYAREDTGEKVKRAMRRGLYAHCHPQKRDFSAFTCTRRTTPPTVTTPPPETTTPATATPPASDRLNNGIDDVNCSDLASPIPTPAGDEDNLDSDGDGTACELS